MSVLVKVLGVADIIAAVLIWIFGIFHILPPELIFVFGFYLLAKGVIFLISKDAASIIDVICAVVFFGAPYVTLPRAIVIIVSLFLLQKGIFSILS